MDLKDKKIHFVGIGGVGMSALAQLCVDQGASVTGCDREASPTTELLEKKGVAVSIGHDASHVTSEVDLLVCTDSIPADNAERAKAVELGVRQISNFQLLGEISKNKKTIAIAGTHGKTTTTGMVAKILADAGASPTAIVGSIVKDFGSNYLPGTSELLVVEADEYKEHLLEFSPQVLLINNLEWDHTDIYPSLEALQATFKKAVAKVAEGGVIVTDPSHPNIAPALADTKVRIVDYTKEGIYGIQLPGAFNQMNARAAAAVVQAVMPSLSTEAMVESLAKFQGTWRRFDYKGKSAAGADVYDDYAHHPTAVRGALEALREKTSGKVYVAFHPHLYSRTRDLLEDFATAFAAADKVIIAPIYAAREVDDGTISNAILAERIRATGVDAIALDSFDAIQEALSIAGPGDSVMTMGAGDIYKVADKLVVPVA